MKRMSDRSRPGSTMTTSSIGPSEGGGDRYATIEEMKTKILEEMKPQKVHKWKMECQNP